MSDKDLGMLLRRAKEYFNDVLVPRCETIMSEVAISINWAEGKAEILEGVTGRQYPERPGWQNGTADLVCLLKTGELLIADWKTGGTDGATEQLYSLACGFQKCLPMDEAGVQSRPVRIACLKVTEEGVDPDERAVSDEQLANHWLAMEIAWSDKDKKNPPVPGIHCTQLYCPHLAYCDAITTVVSDAATEDDKAIVANGKAPLISPDSLLKRHRMTGDLTSDEHAGYVMARVTAARRQMKYYEAMVRKHVENGGKVLAGNYQWRETGSGFRWGKVYS